MIQLRKLFSFSSVKVIDAGSQKMKKLEFKIYKGMKRPRPKPTSIEEVLAKKKKQKESGSLKGADKFKRNGVIYIEDEEGAKWLDAFVQRAFNPKPKEIWKPPKNQFPSTKQALKKLAYYQKLAIQSEKKRQILFEEKAKKMLIEEKMLAIEQEVSRQEDPEHYLDSKIAKLEKQIALVPYKKNDGAMDISKPQTPAQFLMASSLSNEVPEVYTDRERDYKPVLAKHFTGLFPVTIEKTQQKQEFLRKAKQELQNVFSNYFQSQDFEQLKPIRLNREQLLQLIKNHNFLEVGSTHKIIEALHFVSKIKGGLDFYDKRPQIMTALHNFESERHVQALVQQPSYLAALLMTAGRMEITDTRFWNFMASILARSKESLSLRNIANSIFGLSRASRKAPIVLDFSDLLVSFQKQILLALQIENENLMKLRMESGKASQLKEQIKNKFRDISRSLSQITKAYSQLQTGSIQFFRLLEKFIIQQAPFMPERDLANICYSFSKYSHTIDCVPLFSQLLPLFKKKAHQFNTQELSLIMRSFAENPTIHQKLQRSKSEEFSEILSGIAESVKQKHENLSMNDLSQLYFCFVECNFLQPKLFSYFQKVLGFGFVKQLKSHHLRYLFHKFQDPQVVGLFSESLRAKLRGRVLDLIMGKKLSFFQAKIILEQVRHKPMAEGKFHKFKEHLQRYVKQ